METLLKLERQVVPLTRVVALIGLMGLLVQASLTMADVLLRWLANTPIHGLEDINGIAIAIVIASCFPIVIARRTNIAITFLGSAFGRTGKNRLEAMASIALLIFLILIGWQLIVFTGELAESGRTTWLLQLPVTPYWIIATGVYLLCIPVQIVIVLTDIGRAFSLASDKFKNDSEGV